MKKRRITKRAIFAIVILLFFVLCAIFAEFLAPYDPQYVDISQKLRPSSAQHLLGTDQLGRDILSRLLHATRFSLSIAAVITVLEVVLGSFIGLLIGWFEGTVEAAFIWIANVIAAFPSFLLSLAAVSLLGQGMSNMIIAVVAIEWVYYARLMTSLVKKAKQENFVLVANTMGLSSWHILRKHILPFVYRPILVVALMNIGNIIIMISGFSFLGIGVQPNVTEWGMMLHDARQFFRTAIWMTIYPGLAIFLTVISFNLLGEFLEERQWKKDKIV